MNDMSTVNDLQGAERAFGRVQAELDALGVDQLAPLNVDIVSATSIVLGVAERILAFRNEMARLPEFDLRHVDRLVDYAMAAWYAHVTHLPAPDPEDAPQLIDEVTELRAKLLMWALPLAASGKFEPAALDHIREGSGYKDIPSDLVALVGLYRSKWADVKAMCGVTEAELERAAALGPAVFALIGRRENRAASSLDAALRVRRAWTLVDRAYSQCRRALAYLRFEEGDADHIAPSLRRNSGPRSAPSSGTAEPATSTNIASATALAAPAGGPPIGGAGAPFAPSQS